MNAETLARVKNFVTIAVVVWMTVLTARCGLLEASKNRHLAAAERSDSIAAAEKARADAERDARVALEEEAITLRAEVAEADTATAREAARRRTVERQAAEIIAATEERLEEATATLRDGLQGDTAMAQTFEEIVAAHEEKEYQLRLVNRSLEEENDALREGTAARDRLLANRDLTILSLERENASLRSTVDALERSNASLRSAVADMERQAKILKMIAGVGTAAAFGAGFVTGGAIG